LPGPWELRFPSGWGAPSTARLDRLISWSDHADPGVRYFSGTAEYRAEFELPAALLSAGRAAMLDLGEVKNFAGVRRNGGERGGMWKGRGGMDVTGVVKAGPNQLTVRVTNLWPNRLIGDEQQSEEVEWRGEAIAKWPSWLLEGKPRPESRRLTFTTWHFYRKD